MEARDGVAVKQAICPRACRLRGMHPAPVGVGARNQQRRAHDGEAKDLLRRCRESRVSGHAVSGQSVSRESAEGGNRVGRERAMAECAVLHAVVVRGHVFAEGRRRVGAAVRSIDLSLVRP